MTTPVLIVQISDLHIKRPGERAYGVVDTAAALERCIAALNALHPRPAMVVASGDLVDTGEEEEYQYLRHLLWNLELPIVVCPGNHDSRERLRRAFPDQPYGSPDGAANTVVEVKGLDLVLLDSSVPQQPYGELDRETLAWLDKVLASGPDRPALLFLHHPPFQAGIWHMDRQNLFHAESFGELVARSPRVRMIATGHVHRVVVTEFAGVPVTICPAPNHAVDLDLGHTYEPTFRLEPPGFYLHAWFAGEVYGRVVTHFVPIGDFAGPHPFFGPDGKLL